MNAEDNDELNPSELGTKEHWITTYKREIENFNTHGDVGEIWFGEDTAERILRWFDKNVPSEYKICDLGCGNGMFLVEAAHREYLNLTGLDYCQEAVELAKAVAKSNGFSIEFHVLDLIGDINFTEVFDVLVDKGTYDAISLNPNNTKQARLKYMSNVAKLLTDQGFFVMTSCNWTEDELIQQFNDIFSVHVVIPTPTFKFGGKEGKVVSSVVFKKKK